MSPTKQSDCSALGLDQKGCLKRHFYGFQNLHDYRYEVRALTYSGLRNRVIYVRKSLSKDSTLD